MASTSSVRDAFVRPESYKEAASYFADNLFDVKKEQERLSAGAFLKLQATREQFQPLSDDVADEYAKVLKAWAIEKGANNYSHWFLPITGGTGQKHESFVRAGKVGATTEFSGKQLIKCEPDGSSFPSGGLRQTHQARGYTIWDPNSPPFVLDFGTGATLFIPAVLITWSGQTEDEKLPLLRSTAALNRQVLKLLRATGDDRHRFVTCNSGVEQEFFLIDRKYYLARPDLQACGRTLVGADPVKGQERSDQYFGEMSERVTRFFEDAEIELWKLGIPLQCRHREVAPGQYEVAPTFTTAVIASDANILMSVVLDKIARRHELKVLFHEKPFAHLNGSGKHNNWSIGTDIIPTVFAAGDKPHENQTFLLFVAAVMKMADVHGDLLRVAVSGPANDHRLGGHEAPPAIVSIFLGEDTTMALRHYTHGEPLKPVAPVDLGAPQMPSFQRDPTDRNRTSPFAYTGFKFEYRAVGSSQAPHRSNTILNTIMADVAGSMAADIEQLTQGGMAPSDAVHAVVKAVVEKHGRVLWDGDGYSAEWRAEAERRGLWNLKTTVDCQREYASAKNVALFERLGVLSGDELRARQTVFLDEYAKVIGAEAKCFSLIARTVAVPAGTSAITQYAAAGVADLGSTVEQLRSSVGSAAKAAEQLVALTAQGNAIDDALERARFFLETVKPLLSASRECVDTVETLVPRALWPLPSYSDMLFHQD